MNRKIVKIYKKDMPGMDSKCLSRVKREKLCSMVIEAIKISECGSVKPFCFIDAARAADLFHKRGVISMYGSPCMIPENKFFLSF